MLSTVTDTSHRTERLDPAFRDGRLSVLRLIGTIMVVSIHISGMVSANWAGNFWMAGNFYNSLSRSCVPIFLMITGALLIPRHEPYGKSICKRVLRLVPPTIFWACFYFWLSGISPALWPDLIISARAEDFHLWYMYMLIGISFGLPVVGAFYRGASGQERIIVIALWLCFSIFLPFFLGQSVTFNPLVAGLFSPYLGYLFLGAFISELKPNRASFVVGLAAFVTMTGAIILCTWLAASHAGHATEVFYEYLTPLVVIASSGLFTAVMALPIREGRVLRWLADASLGVYVLQLEGIRVAARCGFNALSGNAWITIPETTMVVVIGCFAATWIIRLTKIGRLVT